MGGRRYDVRDIDDIEDVFEARRAVRFPLCHL
jgi:hypothetical protein